jgi:hypothetical protein
VDKGERVAHLDLKIREPKPSEGPAAPGSTVPDVVLEGAFTVGKAGKENKGPSFTVRTGTGEMKGPDGTVVIAEIPTGANPLDMTIKIGKVKDPKTNEASTNQVLLTTTVGRRGPNTGKPINYLVDSANGKYEVLPSVEGLVDENEPLSEISMSIGPARKPLPGDSPNPKNKIAVDFGAVSRKGADPTDGGTTIRRITTFDKDTGAMRTVRKKYTRTLLPGSSMTDSDINDPKNAPITTPDRGVPSRPSGRPSRRGPSPISTDESSTPSAGEATPSPDEAGGPGGKGQPTKPKMSPDEAAITLPPGSNRPLPPPEQTVNEIDQHRDHLPEVFRDPKLADHLPVPSLVKAPDSDTKKVRLELPQCKATNKPTCVCRVSTPAPRGEKLPTLTPLVG